MARGILILRNKIILYNSQYILYKIDINIELCINYEQFNIYFNIINEI